MEHTKDWNGRVAERIGGRVARYRKTAGAGGRAMTAQALADRCTELGNPIDRAVIAKLEKGLRQTVTVAELLVFARALGVPPLALVFAPGWEEEAEVLPDRTVPVWAAMKWFAGEEPLDADSFDDWRADRAGLDTYRYHRQHLAEWQADRDKAAKARERAEQAATEAERAALMDQAETRDRLAAQAAPKLWDHRRRLRDYGMHLPELPAELQHIDDDDYRPDWGWLR